MPAPITAQIFARLSDGFAAFMQCKKILDTPFPFPYAQVVLVVVILFAAILPLQLCVIVNSEFLACAITFGTVWTFCAINQVARELEEPFMDDRNDVNLPDLHVDFNEKLCVQLRCELAPRYLALTDLRGNDRSCGL